MGGSSSSRDFDRDVISAPSGGDASQDDLRAIITAIARASHDIADVISLGRLAPADRGKQGGETGPAPAANARRVLVDHLGQGLVKALHCAGERETITLDGSGRYAVTVDPLEGTPDPDANLPFGTIFSIELADDVKALRATPLVAGFIHYGPQTNLVLTMGQGVFIFNLDRPERTYRLAAEHVKIPSEAREWAIDATKRARWPSSIRALIDEHLEESDAPGAISADMRWTGSLTSDAYRILRRGGVYLCPDDDQPGREDSCPNLRHAARPIAFIIEQAGGCATTGYQRLTDRQVTSNTERTPLIFGSCELVRRIERLHALPENLFDESPLFRKRGLFRV